MCIVQCIHVTLKIIIQRKTSFAQSIDHQLKIADLVKQIGFGRKYYQCTAIAERTENTEGRVQTSRCKANSTYSEVNRLLSCILLAPQKMTHLYMHDVILYLRYQGLNELTLNL